MATLHPPDLLDAMRPRPPVAAIEILDYSRMPAPEGEIEFPSSTLRPAPGAARGAGMAGNECRGFWCGAVRYTGKHRFTIWPLAKFQVLSPRVLAPLDLKHRHQLPA